MAPSRGLLVRARGKQPQKKIKTTHTRVGRRRDGIFKTLCGAVMHPGLIFTTGAPSCPVCLKLRG